MSKPSTSVMLRRRNRCPVGLPDRLRDDLRYGPRWRSGFMGGPRIHVVHVAPTGFGEEGLFGGGERYPLELARAVAGLDGVTCELVTFGPRAATFHDDTNPHLRVRVVKSLGHLGHHPAHPVAPGLVAGLRDADVVHTHQIRSTPSRVAAIVRRLQRRRVVVTDHGLAGSDWRGIVPSLFDQLLAVSRYSASLLDVPADNTHVIYGGADPDRFAPDRRELRRGVLFVGRLTPHKGIDRLLQALPHEANLTIAGTAGHDREPPERDYPMYLRRLAAGPDVQFLTGVDDLALAGLYRQAAVVAVPSVHVTCYGRVIEVSELLGLSTIEAMASGTPVVASRLGGLSELVVDGETGYLVTPGDIAELHDRLRELLDNPRLATRMGDNARSLVLDRYTWNRTAQRCITAYHQLEADPA